MKVEAAVRKGMAWQRGGLAHLPDDVSYLGWAHDNSGH